MKPTDHLTPHAKLLALVRTMVSLTEADEAVLRSAFQPVTVPRHMYLVEPGYVARQLYFINEGYVRVFSLHDGVELTTHLNCPPGFITSFNSFMSQLPAPDYVECLTDTHLLAVNRSDLDRLYAQSQTLAEFGRLIFTQSVAYNEQRTHDMVALSAEQRYLKLMAQHPDIIQHVPLQYVASFIGIKPESLSRIRRQLIS